VAIVEETQFFVTVDGKDVSNRFASRLISLTTTDNSGETADTCRFCLDDKGGTVVMPKKGAPIKIKLGPLNGSAELVFDGLVDDVSSEGSRGGGMVMWIDGKSIDTAGDSKAKKRRHWDDTTVGQAMKDAAKDAKIELTVADRIDKLARTYISQDNESPLHFIQRLARECGGTFKMIGGKKGVVLDRNEGKTADSGSGSGGGGAEVTATVGQNVITWQVSPLVTRPRYKDITARWYDKKEGKYKEQKATVPDDSGGGGGGGGDVGRGGDTSDLPDDNVRNTRVDEEEAQQVADGAAKESDRQKGNGTVMIDGNAKPKAEGKLTIKGARPGIDGTYIIDYVMHELSRGSGWTTTISVVKPQPEGGGDNRQETTDTQASQAPKTDLPE
jgi:phage protein D